MARVGQQDSARFHRAAQNGVQCTTYKSLISGILHLIFPGSGETDCGETAASERETADKGDFCASLRKISTGYVMLTISFNLIFLYKIFKVNLVT